MTLYEKLIEDKNTAMKAREREKTDAIKLAITDVLRREKNPDIDPVKDEEVTAVIKKLVKGEKEMLERSGEETSMFLETLEDYLPKTASEEEIKAWIVENLDLTGVEGPARMKMMGRVMGAFKGNIDGNLAKKVLMDA